MQRSFFEQVLDAVEGFVADDHGALEYRVHGRGLKVWFDHATREHYEAQFVRIDGEPQIEIGFHAEHGDEAANQAVLDHLLADEGSWRRELGDTAEAGLFLGAESWRRVSEVWEPPDPDDPEASLEVAARLVDYIAAIEPARRQTRSVGDSRGE